MWTDIFFNTLCVLKKKTVLAARQSRAAVGRYFLACEASEKVAVLAGVEPATFR